MHTLLVLYEVECVFAWHEVFSADEKEREVESESRRDSLRQVATLSPKNVEHFGVNKNFAVGSIQALAEAAGISCER
jgi:hypothetical protein